jgi:Flp pilus assembly CpaE family ATPase
MNRFDKKTNITPDRVSDNLKQEVTMVIPMDDATTVKAVNRGVPFVLDNKNQPVARGVASLAEAVRTRVNEEETVSE